MRKTYSPGLLWQLLSVLFVSALYVLSQLFAARIHLASQFAPELFKHFKWIRYYEHHFWQLTFAFVCIWILSRGDLARWGFNLQNTSLSGRLFWKFSLLCVLVVLAIVVVPAIIAHDAGPGLITPVDRANTLGWLSFEWVFVGISEEVLFRGLIQTFLERSIPGTLTLRTVSIPYAGLLTTILFCLAHVGSLRHPHIAIDQQLIVFCLSLYASVAYYRTRSLLAPILIHNFNDGLFVTAQTICYRLLHR